MQCIDNMYLPEQDETLHKMKHVWLHVHTTQLPLLEDPLSSA